MSFTAMPYHRLLSAFAAIALGILLVQLIPSHIIAVAANPEGPTEPARHKLFLWRVSGGSGTVYLLGSVHVGKADLYPLPREIEQLFESSDFLVEETDFSKADPAQLRRAWIRSGLYTGGDRLENHISDKTTTALSTYMRATGRSAAPVSLLQPWFLALLIRGEELQVYGLSGKRGIDRHFMDEAVALRKPIIPLETISFHINLLPSLYSSLSDDLQDKLLMSSILHTEVMARRVEAIYEAWKDGDTTAMERLVADERQDPQSKLFLEELVYKRNASMTQQLEAHMSTPNKYFVVVGAGHLIGDHSIVQLLQDRRYKIDQLVVKERAR
jgi:uncharacterized protein